MTRTPTSALVVGDEPPQVEPQAESSGGEGVEEGGDRHGGVDRADVQGERGARLIAQGAGAARSTAASAVARSTRGL